MMSFSNIIMSATELMQRADRLSGAHTGMTSVEIHDIFHALDSRKMKVTYLVELMRETTDSAVRADAKRQLSVLGAQEPGLKGFINQALAGEQIIYKRAIEPKPHKRKFE